MEIEIELSTGQWNNLFGHLDPSSSAYSLVKSAIETNEAPIATPLQKIVLTCSQNDATVAAPRFFPEVVSIIVTALRDSRNK